MMASPIEPIQPFLEAVARNDAVALRALLMADAGVPGIATSLGPELLRAAVLARSPAALTELLEHGVDPNAVLSGGWTSLTLAAHRRLWQMVCILAQGGARPRRDVNGLTPLLAAVHTGSPSFVRSVCSLFHGHSLEVERYDGLTPLGLAAMLGHSSVAEALVELGANVDGGSFPPVSCAAFRKDTAMVEWLVAHGASLPDARPSAAHGDPAACGGQTSPPAGSLGAGAPAAARCPGFGTVAPLLVHENHDSRSLFDRWFARFPAEELWRLVVDGQQQHRGRDGFDVREPGYLRAMLRTFGMLRDLLGVQVDSTLYEQLHAECLRDVIIHDASARVTLTGKWVASGPPGHGAWSHAASVMIDDRLTGPLTQEQVFQHCPETMRDAIVREAADSGLPLVSSPTQRPVIEICLDSSGGVVPPLRPDLHYRDGTGVSFTLLPGSTMTPKGSRELDEQAGGLLRGFAARQPLLRRIPLQPPAGCPSWVTAQYIAPATQVPPAEQWHAGAQPRAAIVAKVQEILDIHDQRIRRPGTTAGSEAWLRSTVACLQSLERLHAFGDGNIRLLGMVLLNKMLMEGGLCPVVFRDPNCVDGFSVDEVIAEIKTGQELFCTYLRDDLPWEHSASGRLSRSGRHSARPGTSEIGTGLE